MERVIPNLKLFLLLIFLSLVTLLLDNFSLLVIPQKFIFYLTNPISFGLYKTKIDIFKQFGFIYSLREAAQQNQALSQQIGQLLSENAKLRKKLSETQALVSQQIHLDPATYRLIAARPIGVDRYLKIDKGSSDGVKTGEAVIYNDNFVGRIVAVSEKAANIQLLTDPDSKVSAFSQSLEGKSKGILIGQFGSEILMDKILHEEKISIGDLVYSEGIESFLPRGLILGKVTQVMENQTQVFKQAKVKPVFDIGDLELVFVIKE